MTVKCWDCGGEGHVASACPDQLVGGWCGFCDERTHLIALTEDQELIQRCPRCHPDRGKLLKQHERCPECHQVIYAWETSLPCDRHRIVADWQRAYHSGQVHSRMCAHG